MIDEGGLSSGFALPRREVRASDEERERTTERLREACAEGRLEADELEERLHHALTARTRGELDALVRDLPGSRGRGSLLRGFYRRAWRAALVSYLTFNAWMIGIWAATGAHYFWPLWTLLPGGIVLLSARLRGDGPPAGWFGRGRCGRLRGDRRDRRHLARQR
jgi:uncharacterized protein DUF1707